MALFVLQRYVLITIEFQSTLHLNHIFTCGHAPFGAYFCQYKLCPKGGCYMCWLRRILVRMPFIFKCSVGLCNHHIPDSYTDPCSSNRCGILCTVCIWNTTVVLFGKGNNCIIETGNPFAKYILVVISIIVMLLCYANIIIFCCGYFNDLLLTYVHINDSPGYSGTNTMNKSITKGVLSN